MSKKILIADDDPAIAEATGLILEEFGYEFNTITDGEKVYDIGENPPDLLLLDVWLSGQDGRDICKYLKAEKETKNLPIIMLSASNEIRNSTIQAGADDFLEKPFDMDELIGKIEKHLN
jgi:DNA-binding response OmpR family regulator